MGLCLLHLTTTWEKEGGRYLFQQKDVSLVKGNGSV